MLAIQLGGVGLGQRFGVDGMDHRFAVVLVQARPDQGHQRCIQALGKTGQRLRVALQRPGQHRVELQAAFAPIAAQRHTLLMAQRAELVVVGRAERGLTVADEVESSHADIIVATNARPCR